MQAPRAGKKDRAAASLSVGEPGSDVRRILETARGAARGGTAELESLGRALDLEGRARRHPYAMIAAAAGTGYLLGRGLFRPLAGRLFRTGLRLAVLPLLEQTILGLFAPAREHPATEGGLP